MKNNQQPRGKFFVWLSTKSYFLMRFILFGTGFTRYENIKMKISDIFADYAPIQDCSVAPMVVSNHVSWADMFFYLWFNVSFLSKESVAHTFLIGNHAIYRQSIFLKREDQKDREKVMQLIKERVMRVKEHNDIHPLLIFPEGTCSNGRTLMDFKKGAFVVGVPIKIFVIKYNNDFQVINSIGNADGLLAILVNILQLWNNITLYEFTDHFDPQYSWNKRGVTGEGPDDWKYVAEDVKSLMKFVSGFDVCSEGFTDLVEFEKQSLTVRNKFEEELV